MLIATAPSYSTKVWHLPHPPIHPSPLHPPTPHPTPPAHPPTKSRILTPEASVTSLIHKLHNTSAPTLKLLAAGALLLQALPHATTAALLVPPPAAAAHQLQLSVATSQVCTLARDMMTPVLLPMVHAPSSPGVHCLPHAPHSRTVPWTATCPYFFST